MGKIDPLKVAIAGYGWWGQHMAKRLKKHSRFTLAGVIEPDDTRGNEISESGITRLESIDRTLEDTSIQAIILTTPNVMLHDIRCG